MGRFPDSRNRSLTTHLIIKAWIQVCSRPDSVERYFTKVGCGMSATGEYKHLIFLQNLYAGDYLSVYDSGENNVVSSIHSTTDIVDTMEAYMKY